MPRLRCAFTTRHAGRSGQSLNLSFDKGERATVLAQRQHVLQALDLAHMPLCTVRQVHGNQVCVVDAALLQRGLTGIAADALVTNLAQVALGILVADCLPIVLYALDTPVIALVHAGRMGTYHRVVQHTLEVIDTALCHTASTGTCCAGPCHWCLLLYARQACSWPFSGTVPHLGAILHPPRPGALDHGPAHG